MSLPAKRQHEETTTAAAAVVKVEARPQQHVGGTSRMVMEFGGAESRPAKVARQNDQEKVEHFNISAYSKPGKDEVSVGEAGNVSKLDAPVVRNKVREFGSGADGVKGDRVDLGRVDSKDHGDVAKSSNEVLGRVVDVRGEEQLQGGVSGEVVVAQEFDRAEGNSEGSRKRSPRDVEGRSVAKREDVAPVECKREEVKEKEKKDERRVERKEDVAPVQQQPPHSEVRIEKEVEKEEVEREKGERVRERERERERERSRDREKEAMVRSEKREKRDKERERDRDRRDEREDIPVEKADGKGITEVEIDRKPVREVEERKVVEKEGRERVREREREKEKEEEGEGEKRKKRGREQEKERDASNAMDTDGGGGEKDKDKDGGHGHSVQQRKRMLRPRGQSNPANRDSRSRFRPKDNEGFLRTCCMSCRTQGRPESTAIVYRVGVGMPELAKLRKEYVESGERNSSANGSGPTVEVHIPADHATTTNRQIRGGHLWGTDIYSDDSDIVAVLVHIGYFSPLPSPPPTSILELRATIRILESQKMYTSTLRNHVRSRAWGGGTGCSYSVERCRIMKQGGGSVELEPCSTRNSQVAPTLAPAASERTVTTRAASSSAYRQQRFMQEVSILYNLCNEPWPKYHMSIVADRGLKKSQFTSARLKKGEALYVETHSHRYELSYEGERTTCNGATTATSSFPPGSSGTDKGKEKWGSTERALAVCEKDAGLHTSNGEKVHGNHPSNGQAGGHHGQTGVHHNGEVHECYRWSRCKRPLSLSSMKDKGVPLPEEYVEVLGEGLRWNEIQWAAQSVWIRDTEYVLMRAIFLEFERDEPKE